MLMNPQYLAAIGDIRVLVRERDQARAVLNRIRSAIRWSALPASANDLVLEIEAILSEVPE